jgi:phosphate transport system permease protein
MVGQADGVAELALDAVGVQDPMLADLSVTVVNAELLVGNGGGGLVSAGGPWWLVWFVVIAGLMLAAILAVRVLAPMMDRRFGRWPRVVSLVLGSVPIAFFAGLVIMIVVRSLPVLDNPGLEELASDRFTSAVSTGRGDYGLLPAVWGTILITLIAVGLALPVSLAVAVMSSEFPMGLVGRVLRPLVGVLAGIPAVVYAVSGVVFVTALMVPKFAANTSYGEFDPARIGASQGDWPPADGSVPWSPGAFPWDLTGINNSTLLGGILIALLLIPFMTPLIFEALSNVPSSAREASLALGANRGHTLRRVILPLAFPGILTALGLGALKALGDTLIVAFVVGWEAGQPPDPLVDALERTSSLTAQGAGLLGGFHRNLTACPEPDCSIGYASALILLVLAALMVVTLDLLHRRVHRRWGA